MKTVLITGVSTGIGLAAAESFVRRGYQVFGSVRKEADGDRVSAELGDGFKPLLFDVTDGAGIGAAVTAVKAELGDQGLRALINNAGIAVPGPLMHMDLNAFRRHLEVNVVGALAVTQAFLPLLGADRSATFPPGRIINISSVSGRIAYPFMGAYAASKHALEAMSDALRRELLLYGIEVIVIEPGTVKTPIIGKFAQAVDQYMQTDYGRLLKPLADTVDKREASALPVERVTAVLVKAVESDHPKTRYPIPRKRFSGWLIPRLLPDRWLDKLVARQLNI